MESEEKNLKTSYIGVENNKGDWEKEGEETKSQEKMENSEQKHHAVREAKEEEKGELSESKLGKLKMGESKIGAWKKTNLLLYIVLIFVAFNIFSFYLNLSLASVAVMLVGGAGFSGSGLASISGDASQDEIISAILPNDADIQRPFTWKGNAVTLSAQTPGNGYDMLVDMDRSIQTSSLDQELLARYNNLAQKLYHPCCNGPVSGCGCKHAIAEKGLIKKLLQDGWGDEEIIEEMFLWARYWWPKHYSAMAVYLVQQGTDPSSISAEEWLSARFSTVNAGKIVGAELGMKLY